MSGITDFLKQLFASRPRRTVFVRNAERGYEFYYDETGAPVLEFTLPNRNAPTKVFLTPEQDAEFVREGAPFVEKVYESSLREHVRPATIAITRSLGEPLRRGETGVDTFSGEVVAVEGRITPLLTIIEYQSSALFRDGMWLNESLGDYAGSAVTLTVLGERFNPGLRFDGGLIAEVWLERPQLPALPPSVQERLDRLPGEYDWGSIAVEERALVLRYYHDRQHRVDAIDHARRFAEDPDRVVTQIATQLARDYFVGRWGARTATAKREMEIELQRRCPGLTVEGYMDAIHDALEAAR